MYAEYLMAKEKHPDCVVLMQYPFCHFLVTYDEDADSLTQEGVSYYVRGGRKIGIVRENYITDVLIAIIRKGSKAAICHMAVIVYSGTNSFDAYWDGFKSNGGLNFGWKNTNFYKELPFLPKFVDRASALFKKLAERIFS